MPGIKFNRREFLQLSGIASLGAIVAACGGTPAAPEPTATPAAAAAPAAEPTATPVPEAPAAPAAAPSKYKEAPMLADLVKAGKLPPVDQRLPAEPLVITPIEAVGKYGGTLRGAHTNPAGFEGWLGAGVEGLLYLGPDFKSSTPNVATSWQMSDDGKSLTLNLREGLKWSDGEPFTADDLMFWWEDVILNDELTPVKPTVWSPGGQPMKMEKLSDTSVRMDFALPYFKVVNNITIQEGINPVAYPKHFLQQYHVKYADKAKLDEAMKAGGVDKWYQLFQKNSPTNSWSIPNVANGAPTLEPFVMNANDKGNVELVRNPYYWKVDPEGNQLPYIDKMSYVLVQDPEAIKLKAIAGEVDFEGLHSILKDYPLYKQNEAAGKYRTLLWNANFAGNICLMFNQNHKDPAKRTILSDVRFRQAVSMGIDRDEINKTIYLGKALMQQAVAYPSTSFYVKEYAEAFTKLDIDAANKLLDEMGFDKKDANGNRADADGKTLAITVEYWNGHAMQSPLELVCDQLRNNLHISITPKSIERTLWSEHMQASEHDATVWLTDKMSENFFTTYPNWLVPISTVESAFGNQWARWFVSNGKEGEEPTGEAKKQIDRYIAMQTASPEDVVKLGKELCQSQSENLWAIGTAATAPMPIVVNSNLANIPTEMPNYGWDWMFTHMTHQETWYFKA